jgi:hypothetical protein
MVVEGVPGIGGGDADGGNGDRTAEDGGERVEEVAARKPPVRTGRVGDARRNNLLVAVAGGVHLPVGEEGMHRLPCPGGMDGVDSWDRRNAVVL